MCTITGAPATQTLNCPETGTFTLAATDSQTVHVTSPTAPGVCAIVANTATAEMAADPATAVASIVVTCPSSVSTTPSRASGPVGLAVHDTADVSNGQPPPGGSVTFAIYTPGDGQCTNNLVASNPGFQNVPLTNGRAASPDYITTQTGIYQWVATYTGDPVHSGSAGTCGDPIEQVTVTETTNPPAPTDRRAHHVHDAPGHTSPTGTSPSMMIIAGLTVAGLGATALFVGRLVDRRNTRQRRA